MGIIEFDKKFLTIHSHIITYGNAADVTITGQIREEIETMWNEPQATIQLDQTKVQISFQITAEHKPHLDEMEVLSNTDPRNNFFRIEQFAKGNISFVDGLGCNTGYFKLENLLPGWTTAAHEYGHTLGLDHPSDLDIRGKGVPGIMYPRGTLVDAQYQYDPSIPAGEKGGTMHPMYRKVRIEDIQQLKIDRLLRRKQMIIGAFSNVYHWDHSELP